MGIISHSKLRKLMEKDREEYETLTNRANKAGDKEAMMMHDQVARYVRKLINRIFEEGEADK